MELNFKFFPKQAYAWKYLTDQETSEIGYGGAASGGKSRLLCYWLLYNCIVYPDTGWLLGRDTLTNLKKTTLLSFFAVCNEHKLIPDSHYKYNQQDNIIRFYNKSEIFLYDLTWRPSDPVVSKLGSLELTGAAIDESAGVNAKVIEIVRTRVGRRNNQGILQDGSKYNLKAKVLETFNPQKNHVYFDYWKPFKEGNMPKNRIFIRSLPIDNPYNSQDYLDILRNSKGATRARLWEGNFDYDDDPNALMDWDCIKDLWTNQVQEREDRWMIIDAARKGRDEEIITIWHGLVLKKIYSVPYEIKKDITKQQDFIEELRGIHSIRRSHIIIDEGGVGGGLVDNVKGSIGFISNSRPIISKKDARKNIGNFGSLRDQCWFVFSQLANRGQVRIECDSAVFNEKIVEDLQQVKQVDVDKDKAVRILSKDIMKENLKRSPDYGDNLMMRMLPELSNNSIGDIYKLINNIDIKAKVENSNKGVTSGMVNKVANKGLSLIYNSLANL